MNLIARTCFLATFLFTWTVCHAQKPAQLLDEFGRINSEDIEARLDGVAAQLNNEPTSTLEIVFHRGSSESVGSVYRSFGIQKAYLLARKVDPGRILGTFCEPGPGTEIHVQQWLLDSPSQRHPCKSEFIDLAKATLFMHSSAPNEKYEEGACCLVDELGYAATLVAVDGFADYLKRYAGTTGYVIVYGGTNLYGLQGPRDRRPRELRRLDPPSFINRLGNDVRRRLLAAKIDDKRIMFINGGYRDPVASVEMWIIPPGARRPKPTPNYFPHTGRRKAH